MIAHSLLKYHGEIFNELATKNEPNDFGITLTEGKLFCWV